MNKYETVNVCRDAYDMGFYDLAECMGRIIDKWTEENGGRMSEEELCGMVEYIEAEEWWDMAHFMQGFFWGACIYDRNEIAGEALAQERDRRFVAR